MTLQLADLHEDVGATADIDPEATELLSTQQFDEYGNPKAESTPKFGWLAGGGRSKEEVAPRRIHAAFLVAGWIYGRICGDALREAG